MLKDSIVTNFAFIASWHNLLFFVMLFSLVSCAVGSQWPHKNFLDIYDHQVGKSVNDPSLYKRKKIGSRVLSDGNIEQEYLHSMGKRGTCRVFYRINPETQTIESWRYEGSDRACAISP